MLVREIRDRCYTDWKRHQESRDAYMAQIANGALRHIVNGEDVTDAITEEKAKACRIFRARFEYFDKLAAAAD